MKRSNRETYFNDAILRDQPSTGQHGTNRVPFNREQTDMQPVTNRKPPPPQYVKDTHAARSPQKGTEEPSEGTCSQEQDTRNVQEIGYSSAFWKSLKKWADSTTFHGIRNVFDTETDLRRRAVWVILILTVIVFLMWFVGYQIQRYFLFRTHTQRAVTFGNIMPFPAITVCSLNLIRNDSIHDASERQLLKLLQNPNMNRTTLLENFQESFIRNITLKTLYRNGTMKPEAMFRGCFWETKELDCLDVFKLQQTDSGYCYTFNARSLGEWFDWEYVTKIPGSLYGLHIHLWTGLDNYFVTEDHSAGFKVLVHHIYDQPDMNFAEALEPGRLHSLSMRRHEYRYIPERGCVNVIQEEVKAIDYDPLDCVLNCRTEYVYQACGCIGPFDRGELKECDPIQLVDCYRPAVVNFSLVVHECPCPAPCHVLTFDTKLSSSYLVENVLGDNNDPNWKENLVVLKVFFENKYLTLDDEVMAYTFGDLWAAFGGYMGLATGCSILTFLEIIEFFIVRLVAYVKLKKAANRRRESLDSGHT